MVNSRWLDTNETADNNSTAGDPALSGKVKNCYNDVQVAGSSLTLSNSNSGITKTVSVTGGGTAVQGLNSASLTGNTLSFTKTDGAAADTIDLSTSTLGGVATANSTAITTINTNLATLSGSVANNLGNITLLHSNVATNTANIVTNTTDIATNTADISALQSSGGAVDSITFNFTVQSVGGYNKYFINGEQGGLVPIELLLMHKYVFNYPASHPLRLSRTPDGTHASGIELTLGVTHLSPDGINQTQTIFVNTSMFTTNLYYYCSNHSGMGGFIMEDNGFNNIRSITYNSAVPELQIERAYAGEFSHPSETITLPNPYISSSITGQNLTLNKAVGAADTITIPSSAPSTTTVNYPTSAMTADTTGNLVTVASSVSTSPSSPAFHAFDKDATTEWLSQSNTYSTTDGSYVGYSNLGVLTTSGNADNGEFVKIDLGTTKKAKSLNLKSVAEYREPIINMTNYNQYGYEVTASSEATTGPGYLAFNNLTTPIADRWIAGSAKYDPTSGSYVASARLSTDYPGTGGNPATADGEYLMIKLPDKRKLVAYKLTREDGTFYQFSPQDFTLYARESSTSDWVNLTSESLTTSTILGNYTTGGGTRFPSTGDLTPTTAYQYFALVVSALWQGNHQTFALSEFELFCEPAEIENFKLYGSTDDVAWTEIHNQSTSANIISSGTDFTITNSGSYQHYGIVVTKTNNNNNVSIGEMTLGVDSPFPQCLAKGTWIKPLDTANTGGNLGVLSNEFNISTISQLSTVYAVARYGVNHRFFSFNVTFTTPLTNANYQVNITEFNQYKSIANYYGCILNHSVMNKQTIGFDIYVLVDPLGFTTSFPSFGLDFMVF